MSRRSVLFAPGDKPAMMRKTPQTGADVVCFDLEDAVAPGAKPAARDSVNNVLTDPAFAPECEVVVRINPDSETARADVETALDGEVRLDAVMAPKVEGEEDIERIVTLLEEQGIEVPILALCESALGVLDVQALAAMESVDALVFGAEDLAADIGATRTADGTEVLYARERVVLAAAAAGIDAIDTLHTDIEDTDGLAADTRFAIELGYDGKLCIHPTQVGIINDAFTPSDDRVEWARRVLDAAAEADSGVFRVDGEMIDPPLITQAERVRDRAVAAGIWPPNSA